MPDVKVYKRRTIRTSPAQKLDFFNNLAIIVAEQMSCFVPSSESDGYEYYQLNPAEEIDITIFGNITGQSKASVIIEVAAYDFEDRLYNMTDRLKLIAALVARELDVDPASVSISFIPIKQGHWTTGAEES